MLPRTSLLMAAAFFLASFGSAQNLASPVASPPVPAPAAPVSTLRTPQQLEFLLGPIALYPDALIGIILPASTVSSDIVLAARFQAVSVDPDQLERQSWDPSVKSLVYYPELVKWLDDNLAWTKQVGEAFVSQPADVMQAIQRLRAQARAAGTLIDTPQQQVAVLGDEVRIVPTQPNVIYIPSYDPDVVYGYSGGGYAGPFLTFGFAYVAGPWLIFDCDWRLRRIWVVDHRADWQNRRDWRQPVFPGNAAYVSNPDRHPWHPSASFVHSTSPYPRVSQTEITRPTPMAATLVRRDPEIAAAVRAPNPTRSLIPTPATAAPAVASLREPVDQSSGDRRDRPRAEFPANGNSVAGSTSAPVVVRERAQSPNVTVIVLPRAEYSRPPPTVQAAAAPAVTQAQPVARAPVAEPPRPQVQAPVVDPIRGVVAR